jgi:hypothetical protein
MFAVKANCRPRQNAVVHGFEYGILEHYTTRLNSDMNPF